MHSSPSDYLRVFSITFLRECYRTWRQELLASVLVSVVTYGLMARSHDPAAWGSFKVALIASGLVLGAFAIWHLFRTPFLIHGQTVERMQQESASALESQRNSIKKEAANRVSPSDWREISDKFSALVSHQISAQFQATREVTRWTMYDTQCKALCTLAGTMLLTSAGVSPHLSDAVKGEPDPISRWLLFLKTITSCASYRVEYAYEILDNGEKLIHVLGRIDNVPRESSAVCLKCCAQELMG